MDSALPTQSALNARKNNEHRRVDACENSRGCPCTYAPIIPACELWLSSKTDQENALIIDFEGTCQLFPHHLSSIAMVMVRP